MDPNCLPKDLPAGWVPSGDGRVGLPDACLIGGRELGGWAIFVDPERTDGLTLAERTTSEPLARLAVTGLARRSVTRETTLLRDQDVLGAAWGGGSREGGAGTPDHPATPDPSGPSDGDEAGDDPLALGAIRRLMLSRVGAEQMLP